MLTRLQYSVHISPFVHITSGSAALITLRIRTKGRPRARFDGGSSLWTMGRKRAADVYPIVLLGLGVRGYGLEVRVRG